MALLTTAQELAQVREAIQGLQTGVDSFQVDGISFKATNLHQLLQRERELLRRVSIKQVRKRTRPDFS